MKPGPVAVIIANPRETCWNLSSIVAPQLSPRRPCNSWWFHAVKHGTNELSMGSSDPRRTTLEQIKASSGFSPRKLGQVFSWNKITRAKLLNMFVVIMQYPSGFWTKSCGLSDASKTTKGIVDPRLLRFFLSVTWTSPEATTQGSKSGLIIQVW